MRQERLLKRPVRRRNGGGDSDAAAPVPARPAPSHHVLRKTDDLLRRMDRLITG